MILCDIYVVYEGSNFIFTYLHCKRILSSSLGSVQYVGTKWLQNRCTVCCSETVLQPSRHSLSVLQLTVLTPQGQQLAGCPVFLS